VEALRGADALHVRLLDHRHDAALRIRLPDKRLLCRLWCVAAAASPISARAVRLRLRLSADGTVECNTNNSSLLTTVVEASTEQFICRSVRVLMLIVRRRC